MRPNLFVIIVGLLLVSAMATADGAKAVAELKGFTMLPLCHLQKICRRR